MEWLLELFFVNFIVFQPNTSLLYNYSVPLMIVNLVAHFQSVSFAQYDIFQKCWTVHFVFLHCLQKKSDCFVNFLLVFVTAHDTVWKVLRLLVFTRKVTLFERGSYRLQRSMVYPSLIVISSCQLACLITSQMPWLGWMRGGGLNIFISGRFTLIVDDVALTRTISLTQWKTQW